MLPKTLKFHLLIWIFLGISSSQLSAQDTQNIDQELDELLKAEGFDIDLNGELLTEEDLSELLDNNALGDLFKESNWELDLKIRAGLGYGDNVLYGAFEDVSSGYFLGSVDGLYYRTKDDDWNAFVYFFGEHLEYFENVDSGRLYVTQGQLSRITKDQKQNLGLSATHLFYDQVFDASADLDTFNSLGVSAHQIEVEPFVDFYLPNESEFRIQGLFSGSRFEDSYDDSDSLGALVRLKRPFGELTTVTVEYFFEDRNFLERASRDSEGFAIDGETRLQIGIATITLKVDEKEPEGWSFRSELSHYSQRDQEAGFTDFDRIRISQKASKSWDEWELYLAGRYTWFDHLVRIAEFGGDDLMYRRVFEATLALTREISDQTSIFFESQYERNRSNSPDNIFSATRLVIGLERAL